MKQAVVVDDDKAVAAISCRWLRDAGFETIGLNNFLAAYSQLRRRHPQTLVVDVRLGDVNGLQLAILAREQWPDVRIVVISGWDDPVIRQEAAHCGATYLLKPFNASQLLNAIESPESPSPCAHRESTTV